MGQGRRGRHQGQGRRGIAMDRWGIARFCETHRGGNPREWVDTSWTGLPQVGCMPTWVRASSDGRTWYWRQRTEFRKTFKCENNERIALTESRVHWHCWCTRCEFVGVVPGDWIFESIARAVYIEPGQGQGQGRHQEASPRARPSP